MTDAKQFSATLFLRHIVSRFSHLFSKSNCTLLLFVLRFEIRKKVIQIQVHFELNDQFKVHRGTVFENYRKSLILQWRAKRATFTFWVDKCQKWSILTSFFLTWSLLSKSVTRTKIIINIIFSAWRSSSPVFTSLTLSSSSCDNFWGAAAVFSRIGKLEFKRWFLDVDEIIWR